MPIIQHSLWIPCAIARSCAWRKSSIFMTQWHGILIMGDLGTRTHVVQGRRTIMTPVDGSVSRSICSSGGGPTDTAMTTVINVLCLNWVHPMLLIPIPVPTHVRMRMDVMNLMIVMMVWDQICTTAPHSTRSVTTTFRISHACICIWMGIGWVECRMGWWDGDRFRANDTWDFPTTMKPMMIYSRRGSWCDCGCCCYHCQLYCSSSQVRLHLYLRLQTSLLHHNQGL